MAVPASTPLLGFAAFSGTGKTTLLLQLIPLLKQRGVRLAVIKHAHHAFDVDQPGKDSYELRHAGAGQMLIASSKRWALMTETPEAEDPPDLEALSEQLDVSRLDLILVEGFKAAALPKIEVHRPSLGHPLLYPNDPHIEAVASDQPLELPQRLRWLDLNQPAELCDYILTNFLPSRRLA